jgi:hypothetical protein
LVGTASSRGKSTVAPALPIGSLLVGSSLDSRGVGGGGGGACGSGSTAVLRSARVGVGSGSASPRVVAIGSGLLALSAPPSASSRYGLSPVSAPALLDGRRPRPRRGGRRLSLMPLCGEKVNLVRDARGRCGPGGADVFALRATRWTFPSAYAAGSLAIDGGACE